MRALRPHLLHKHVPDGRKRPERRLRRLHVRRTEIGAAGSRRRGCHMHPDHVVGETSVRHDDEGQEREAQTREGTHCSLNV